MIVSGECRYCHCTDSDPCLIRDGVGRLFGCSWVDAEQTICSMPMCQQAAFDGEILDLVVRGRLILSSQE
jgi:hypothetical protein